jgi:iron complex outermembrane receptor protein
VRLRILLAGCALASSAQAQDRYIEDLVVTAPRIKPSMLTAAAPIASGLGLTGLQTPASVDSVDLADQFVRGPRTVAEATRGVTGLTFTTRSGAPGVFSSRGFTENALVTLYDGLRVQSATITARAYDPFNFERIDVLRGPGSVVLGEGATAGAVNYVRRKPRVGDLRFEGVIEGGEQSRLRAGLAASGGLSQTIGFSLSASGQQLGSFVEDTQSDTIHIVGSIGGKLDSYTGFLVEVDHLHARVDDAYFGQPLVAGAIDDSIFELNYNRSPNNRMSDDVTWVRGVVTHQFSPALDYKGQVYSYGATRDWRNFYAFSYIAGPPQQVEARNVESLGYDHDLWGTRHDLKLVTNLGEGIESRSVFAIDYTNTSFSSPRRDGPPASGAPRPRFALNAPLSVAFDQGVRLRQREAEVQQTGLAYEQRLAMGRFAIVGGARVTIINATLARPEASPPVAPFDLRFRPFDWRAAATFEPADNMTLYATVTSGNEPVESLLLLPVSQANLKLAKSTGYEIGYKAQIGSISLTAAGFILTKDRLPSVNPTNPNLPPQVGRQNSKGIELSGRYDSPVFSASANLAYTDAVFREVNDFGSFRDGVRPANVPDLVINADVAVRPIERLSLGGFVQHVSSRPSNNGNQLFLPAYTTVDLFVSWQFTPSLTFTGRVANITDERYVEWATQSFGQNNLYFGSSRRFEASLAARF